MEKKLQWNAIGLESKTKTLLEQINLEKKISIISRDKPLHEILKEIEKKGKILRIASEEEIKKLTDIKSIEDKTQ